VELDFLKSKFTDREIIEKGSRALIRELGYSGFLRYIRQKDGVGKNDYLQIKEEMFEGMTLDEIYEGAKEHWEEV
jgi:phage host-nuclease inhibitor protein Gam